MGRQGGTPSWQDKHVTLAAISPPSVARGRFVGGQPSGLAGCKPPPLLMRRASSCSSQGRRQGEPWGASPRPSAPTYLPPPPGGPTGGPPSGDPPAGPQCLMPDQLAPGLSHMSSSESIPPDWNPDLGGGPYRVLSLLRWRGGRPSPSEPEGLPSPPPPPAPATASPQPVGSGQCQQSRPSCGIRPGAPGRISVPYAHVCKMKK